MDDHDDELSKVLRVEYDKRQSELATSYGVPSPAGRGSALHRSSRENLRRPS
jgi:hypothetical protein